MVLICISLKANAVARLFTCVLAFRIPSLEKCLCRSFTVFSDWMVRVFFAPPCPAGGGGGGECLLAEEAAGWAGSGPRGPAGCQVQSGQRAVFSRTNDFNYCHAPKFKAKWPQQCLQRHPRCSQSLYKMFRVCPVSMFIPSLGHLSPVPPPQRGGTVAY